MITTVLFPFPIKTAAEALADPDTCATVIHLILLSAYGDALYGTDEQEPIDPVELYALVKEDFRVEMPEDNENRLQALLLGIATNDFFEDPEAFAAVSQALFDGDLGDLVNGIMEEPSLFEVLWATYEVALNRDDEPEFSPSVKRYIAQVAGHEADEAEGQGQDFSSSVFQRFVDSRKAELLEQLNRLGINPEETNAFVYGNKIRQEKSAAETAASGE